MRQGLYVIRKNEPVARGVYMIRFDGATDALTRAGQFVNIKIDGLYLRRPFSVADWDSDGLVILYKVVGEGTRRLASMKPDQTLDMLVGLGNGFNDGLDDGLNDKFGGEVSETASRSPLLIGGGVSDAASRAPLLIGGGVGVPPLFALAKRFISKGIKPTALLGFAAGEDVILADELRDMGCYVIVTLETDGERVTDRLDDAAAGCDQFFACGPEGMLRAVAKRCALPGQLSLESRMACGVGLCRGCTCLTLTGGKRTCIDGPVFDKEELAW